MLMLRKQRASVVYVRYAYEIGAVWTAALHGDNTNSILVCVCLIVRVTYECSLATLCLVDITNTVPTDVNSCIMISALFICALRNCVSDRQRTVVPNVWNVKRGDKSNGMNNRLKREATATTADTVGATTSDSATVAETAAPAAAAAAVNGSIAA
jgi:hypothetical protein